MKFEIQKLFMDFQNFEIAVRIIYKKLIFNSQAFLKQQLMYLPNSRKF